MTNERRQKFVDGYKNAKESVVPIESIPSDYYPFKDFCQENRQNKATLRRKLQVAGCEPMYTFGDRKLSVYYKLADMQGQYEIIKLNKVKKC